MTLVATPTIQSYLTVLKFTFTTPATTVRVKITKDLDSQKSATTVRVKITKDLDSQKSAQTSERQDI